MIFETWMMPIVEAVVDTDGGSAVGPLSALRLLRLLRLARMGRLMRFVPELAKLVKGMVRAARSVVFILIFLILIIYVTAIIFTGQMADLEKTPFCSWLEHHSLNITYDDEGNPECLAEGEFGGLGRDMFKTMGDSCMSLF